MHTQQVCYKCHGLITYNTHTFFKHRSLTDSVTDMMSEHGLPSSRTLFNDSVHKFNQQWFTSVNGAVRHFI